MKSNDIKNLFGCFEGAASEFEGVEYIIII